jgi:small subunit ribosomal protein S17
MKTQNTHGQNYFLLNRHYESLLKENKKLLNTWKERITENSPVEERFELIKEDVKKIVSMAFDIASDASHINSHIYDDVMEIVQQWSSLAAYSGSYISQNSSPQDHRHFGGQLINGNNSREIKGIVVAANMEKTVTVEVTRTIEHPLTGKYIPRSKKYLVHDEYGNCKVGDKIIAIEGRPLSKRKRHSFAAKIYY